VEVREKLVLVSLFLALLVGLTVGTYLENALQTCIEARIETDCAVILCCSAASHTQPIPLSACISCQPVPATTKLGHHGGVTVRWTLGEGGAGLTGPEGGVSGMVLAV
jgi:hypothetical protein